MTIKKRDKFINFMSVELGVDYEDAMKIWIAIGIYKNQDVPLQSLWRRRI